MKTPENFQPVAPAPEKYPAQKQPLLEQLKNNFLLFAPEGFRTLDVLVDSFQKDGKKGVFELQGATRNYVAGDRETAKEALRTTPRHPLHASEKKVLGEEGLFTLPNGDLQRSKRLDIAKYFSDSTVREVYFNNLGNYIYKKSKAFVDEMVHSSVPVDAETFSKTVAVGSMIETIIPLGWSDAEMLRFSKHILNAEMYAALAPEFALPYLARDLHHFENQISDLLVNILQEPEKYTDARFGYMQTRARDLGQALLDTPVEKRAEVVRQKSMEVLSILTAGEITTYSAIESVLVFLGSNPEVAEALRRQIRAQWPEAGSASLDHMKLKEVPLLEKVVDYVSAEVPPIPDIFRRTGDGIMLGGTKLEANGTVHIPVRALYRTGEKFDAKKNYESLMFGTGERVCLGGPLAKFELMAVALFLVDQADAQGVTLVSAVQDPTVSDVVA